MKKVLFIYILINSFTLVFISHYASASLECSSEYFDDKAVLKKNGYRLCYSSEWSHECGTLNNLFSHEKYGLRWTKMLCCDTKVGVYVAKLEKKALSDLKYPRDKKCIFSFPE